MAAGKQKVPLVMGRHSHHRARAVIGQHVIGDPKRNLGAAGGVDHVTAQGHSPFGAILGGALLLALAVDQIAERRHRQGLLGAGQALDAGVVRGQHQIGGSVNGVGSGGEDADRLRRSAPIGRHHAETQFSPFRAADPVGLHRAHPLRPARQGGQVIHQGIGIGGDAQKPLAQQAFFHLCPRAPGPPFAIHLFVGQHGLVDRIPVDAGLLLIGQAGIEELQEQPLGPAVVVGMAGGDLPLPVDRKAQPLQLAAHLGNVLLGPVRRIDAPFNRRVLRRQPERIPAHRMQHAPAPHALHAGIDIGDHIVAHMAHVQAPRGIGEHREGIAGLSFALLRGVVQIEFTPAPLPAFFNRLGEIA